MKRAVIAPKRSDPKNIVQVSLFLNARLLPDFMVLIYEKSRLCFSVLWFYKVRLSSSFLKTIACLAFRKIRRLVNLTREAVMEAQVSHPQNG